LSVEAAQPRIDLLGDARLSDEIPGLREGGQIVGMDCRLPAVAGRLIQAKTGVFAPPTINKIAPAVSLRGPDQPGKRIHNAAEIDLHPRTFVTAHSTPQPPSSLHDTLMILSALRSWSKLLTYR
jgi:hypothetical protein